MKFLFALAQLEPGVIR